MFAYMASRQITPVAALMLHNIIVKRPCATRRVDNKGVSSAGPTQQLCTQQLCTQSADYSSSIYDSRFEKFMDKFVDRALVVGYRFGLCCGVWMVAYVVTGIF